jgi:hypothetical protein
MSEKYDSAVIYYEIAFKNKDFPFDSDLKNAAFCESKLPQPSLERCKYYVKNGISKWYLKEKLGMDTTLMNDFILNSSFIEEIYDTINKMVERDQYARKVEYSTMSDVDSTNIEKYKELLKTTDLLDERIARSYLGYLGTLFIHWLDYKNFRAFITPLMLKAVQDGRYDARRFAEQMDYAIFRDNDFNGSFLQYGTFLRAAENRSSAQAGHTGAFRVNSRRLAAASTYQQPIHCSIFSIAVQCIVIQQR